MVVDFLEMSNGNFAPRGFCPNDGAYDVTLFEDLENGQTKLTFIGNEPMESARKRSNGGLDRDTR